MKKKTIKTMRYFLVFTLEIILFLSLLAFADSRIMPPLMEISHMQCKAYANRLIDEAAQEIFLRQNTIEWELIPAVSENRFVTNTALINRYCSSFSSEINKRISKIPYEEISIPLGAAWGFGFLADTGPNVPFTFYPMGSVNVDYETEFRSAGINQINYKIWLDISMEMKIVNPLSDEKVTLQRKILLADMVLSGNVPDHYFQMSSPGEYLLTE
ncbi:MAG: sporulation protein YunB [Anaerotignum sp.]|nr:sporulation protein YunB [Anaerotignum sp.]